MSGGAVCYDAPSNTSVTLAIFLILATLASYIPQAVAIIESKTSAGLSFVSLGNGLLSGLLILINTGILNWDKIVCCRNHPSQFCKLPFELLSLVSFDFVLLTPFLPTNLHQSVSQCLANNLVVEQVSVSPLCLFIIYLLFLFYFDHIPNIGESRSGKLREYFWSLTYFAFAIDFAIFTAAMAFLLYFGNFITGTYMYYYGKFVGIVASLLVFFQWAPQIWITWRKQEAGALSLPSLIMQAPGSFIVVGFQLSANSDWTTWAPYGVAGIQQLILIGMLVYFYWKKRKQGTAVQSVV